MNILERNFVDIRKEAKRCLETYPVLSYVRDRNFSINSQALPEEPGWVKSWPVPPSTDIVKFDFGLIVSDRRIDLNARQCPKTMDVLTRKMKRVSVAGFSWLKPRSTLHRHLDKTVGSFTAHLGLIVENPSRAPLFVFDTKSEDAQSLSRVDLSVRETIYQQEGVAFSFDDSYLHEAHNWADSHRVVLYLNIDHETDEEEDEGGCSDDDDEGTAA